MTIRKLQKQRALGFGVLLALFISTILILGTRFGSSVDYRDQDSDGDMVPDDMEITNSRNIELTITPISFLINTSLVEQSEADDVEYRVSIDSQGLTLSLRYKPNGGTYDAQKSVIFHSVTEFVDIDGDGILGGSDTIIHDNSLSNLVFKGYDNSLENGSLHNIEFQTADQNFTIDFLFSGTFNKKDDIIISPNQVYIEFGIHNYNYGSDPNSILAIQIILDDSINSTIVTDTPEEQLQYHSNERSVQYDSTTPAKYFAWSENAKNETSGILVKNTPVQTTSGIPPQISISIGRGQSIQWDSYFGVNGIYRNYPNSDNNLKIDSVSVLIGIGIGAALIGSISLYQARKHTKTGHVSLLKRGEGSPPSNSTTPEGEIEAVKHTKTGHVSLLKRGEGSPPSNSTTPEGKIEAAKHTKTGHVSLLKRGEGSPPSNSTTPEGEIEAGKHTKTGHVNLMKREIGPSSPNSDIPIENSGLAGNPIKGMTVKGGITDPNEGLDSGKHTKTGHVSLLKRSDNSNSQ